MHNFNWCDHTITSAHENSAGKCCLGESGIRIDDFLGSFGVAPLSNDFHL